MVVITLREGNIICMKVFLVEFFSVFCGDGRNDKLAERQRIFLTVRIHFESSLRVSVRTPAHLYYSLI